MRPRRKLSFKWGLLLLFPIFPALSFGAVEGTAHLTFQKRALSQDKNQPYIVRKGDTLAAIIRKLGITAPPYRKIKKLNPQITDLNLIYPGQKIILLSPAEQKSASGDSGDVRHYRIQKGDSLTRIIVAELQSPPAEVAKKLNSIKRLNPNITNLNMIFPGQVLKIPGGKSGENGLKEPPQPTRTDMMEAPPLPKTLLSETTLHLLGQIIKQLNGALITSGSYYIPLPVSGQLTLDCTTIPVVELDDGTTVLLDSTGRVPRELATIIEAHWKNYHLVKVAPGIDVVSLLREILLPSGYEIKKPAQPLLLGEEPQVRLFLDWLITKKTPAASGSPRLGLIFAADKSPLLPREIVSYAQKKGLTIWEILDDKLQENPAKQAPVPPLVAIKAGSQEELIYNFLVFMGLEPIPDREIKIFDRVKDGFDLVISAQYLVKKGNKTLVILKNKLPQQFSEILNKKGMEPYYPSAAATGKGTLEGLLAALAIRHQFALFSLPPAGGKSRFHVYFPALKVEREKGAVYLTDIDMDRELYELLTGYGKLDIAHY